MKKMMNELRIGFIVVLIVVTMCPLVYEKQIIENFPNNNQAYFHPSLQNDTVFENFQVENNFTNFWQCTPRVSIDVSDSDGIDSVWFTYRRSKETSVLNKSMDMYPYGDLIRCVGYFTVTVSQTTTEFIIQFHANDSLGHQTSSDEYSLFIRYDPGTSADGSIDPFQITGLILVVLLPIGFIILWRRGRIGWGYESR